jgi:hypothetical protein
MPVSAALVFLAPHIHAAVEAKPEGDPFVFTLLGWAFAVVLCTGLFFGLFVTTFIAITPLFNVFLFYFPQFDYKPPEPAYQEGRRKPVTRAEVKQITKEFLNSRQHVEMKKNSSTDFDIVVREARVEHEALWSLARIRPGMKLDYLIARRFTPKGATKLCFARLKKNRALTFDYETAARWLDVIKEPDVFMVPNNVHARFVCSQALFRGLRVSDIHQHLRNLGANEEDSTEPVLAPSSNGAGQKPVGAVPAPLYSYDKPKEAFAP